MDFCGNSMTICTTSIFFIFLLSGWMTSGDDTAVMRYISDGGLHVGVRSTAFTQLYKNPHKIRHRLSWRLKWLFSSATPPNLFNAAPRWAESFHDRGPIRRALFSSELQICSLINTRSAKHCRAPSEPQKQSPGGSL